jgi:hypothetical protein
MLLLMLSLATLSRAADSPRPITLKGEVVDLHCHITKGASGEKHAGCAEACISRGVPAGFLADNGTLYVLLDEKMISVKDKVAGKVGKSLTASGFIVEKDGMRLFKLVSLE